MTRETICVAVTVAVDNQRDEDTAQSTAETAVRDRLKDANITPKNIRWSETVSRPTFTDRDTLWGIQVTATIYEADAELLDNVDAEAVEEVAVQEDTE